MGLPPWLPFHTMVILVCFVLQLRWTATQLVWQAGRFPVFDGFGVPLLIECAAELGCTFFWLRFCQGNSSSSSGSWSPIYSLWFIYLSQSRGMPWYPQFIFRRGLRVANHHHPQFAWCSMIQTELFLRPCPTLQQLDAFLNTCAVKYVQARVPSRRSKRRVRFHRRSSTAPGPLDARWGGRCSGRAAAQLSARNMGR